MVRGFESFKEWFKGYEDEYVIIGGVACDLLMEAEGQSFRATKDLDMVLIVDALTPEFVKRFWEYVKDAGYEHLNKSTGNVQFYRFSKPKDSSYLYMIELFSRRPNEVFLQGEPHLTPIPSEDEISSLSAILLDETYYNFLKDGRIMIDGTPVLEVKHLIPFKAKAYLDNTKRKEAGEQVDSRDIKKHKNDVFRLLLLLPDNDDKVWMPKQIMKDMEMFIERMSIEDIDTKAFGAGRFDRDYLIDKLRRIYK